MKKTVRMLAVMAMVVLMLTTAIIPAMADDFDFEDAIAGFTPNSSNCFTLEVGECHVPAGAVMMQHGDAHGYSSNRTVVTISYDGTVMAVSEGSAFIAIQDGDLVQLYRYDVVKAVHKDEEAEEDRNEYMDLYEDQANDMMSDFKETRSQIMSATRKSVDMMFTIVMVLIAVVLLAGVASAIYIFITAPKCGMSRAWAIAPLISSVIGLLVFIAIRSSRKTTASTNTVICPTCNSVHPAGTSECSICGTKLH